MGGGANKHRNCQGNRPWQWCMHLYSFVVWNSHHIGIILDAYAFSAIKSGYNIID